MVGGFNLTGVHHRGGYVEDELQELEARISLDVNAQIRSKAALLNLVTREIQGIYDRADARGLGKLYGRLKYVLRKLYRILPSLKRDIEVKGWRNNPWLAWELDFNALYFVAAMDHVDFLKSEQPLEFTYEDFNAAFPWEVLDRIKSLMVDNDWPVMFSRLMKEYGPSLGFAAYYSDLAPFESAEEAFFWTGDLIVEILSDIMLSNLTMVSEEKEKALAGRVEVLENKISRLSCRETRSKLGKRLAYINDSGGKGADFLISGDRFLEVSLLETEVDDLLTRQENRRLFQEGRKWELFQNTPRSWFV